jgi:hypothetical protein
MSDEIKTNALTDEEVSGASGGAGFQKCPMGHYEATGFASILGSPNDCTESCPLCTATFEGTGQTKDEFKFTTYMYTLHCSFFNRTTKAKFLKEL